MCEHAMAGTSVEVSTLLPICESWEPNGNEVLVKCFYQLSHLASPYTKSLFTHKWFPPWLSNIWFSYCLNFIKLKPCQKDMLTLQPRAVGCSLLLVKHLQQCKIKKGSFHCTSPSLSCHTCLCWSRILVVSPSLAPPQTAATWEVRAPEAQWKT